MAPFMISHYASLAAPLDEPKSAGPHIEGRRVIQCELHTVYDQNLCLNTTTSTNDNVT